MRKRFKVKKHTYRVSLLIVSLVTAFSLIPVAPVEALGQIFFPVIGSTYFSNDFNSPRSNGLHHATDIMGSKGQPIIAAQAGTVYYVTSPQPSWGYSVGIRDSEGYEYRYLHMNNDTPGTDDSAGGEMNAFAPDMKVGNHVEQGQLLGWVGDSGNAETTAPHLHFEIYDPNDNAVNPYDFLMQSRRAPHPSLYPPLSGETLPYWVSYGGGLNLAMGNFDADPQMETVTGAGAGGGPHVKIFDTDNTFAGTEFFALDGNFTGGIDVAAGDINNDGVDEVIVGAGPSGGPVVRVFDIKNGTLLMDRYVYGAEFRGGVRVASADLNNDGFDEVITGVASNGGPVVRAFDLKNGTLLSDFFAYAPTMTSGIDVTSADVIGNSDNEIIVSAGPGAGPHVRVMNRSGGELAGFYPYDSRFDGGVRVSAANVRTGTPKSEIMVAPASKGGPHIRLLDAYGGNIAQSMYLESWWSGYYDAAAGTGTARVGTGTNRRASMRNIF